jgi:hypothetical protein
MMAPAFEPAIVTRLLERVSTHGTAASELFLVFYAIRGLALLAGALVSLGAGRRQAAA